MMLKVIPRLEDRCVHLLHCITKLNTEPAQDIALPSIILGIHACLHLLIVNHTNTEVFLGLRSVEGRSSFLDLSKQLLPAGERIAESVENVFGFEVPQGLELQPLRDIVLQLLHFVLDKCERPF